MPARNLHGLPVAGLAHVWSPSGREWAGKLYALWEAHNPFVLDPATLNTIGEEQFGEWPPPASGATVPIDSDTCLMAPHQAAPATVWIAPERRCSSWVHAADLGAATMQMEFCGQSSRSRPIPATTRTPAGSWRSATAFGTGRVSPAFRDAPCLLLDKPLCAARVTRVHMQGGLSLAGATFSQAEGVV